MELYPHQKRNIELLTKALTTYGCALDASQTGTGKTATAVALCASLGAQPAIVCPLATIPSWRETCAALGVTPLFVANYEQVKTEAFPFTKFTRERVPTKLNPDKFTKHVHFGWQDIPPRTIFIFDEAQRCRAKDSETSQIMLETVKRYKTLLLTATPFTHPGEAYAIGYALKLFSMDGFWAWCARHGMRKGYLGKGLVFKGTLDDMARIHHSIFPLRGVRTTHAEIPGFPETLITTRAVPAGAPDEITQIYLNDLTQAVEGDFARAREGIDESLWEYVEPLALTRGLRARQRAELLKVPAMVELAKDALDQNMAVAVFLNFDASIAAFRQRLPTKCVVSGNQRLYAADGGYNRINAIRQFQYNIEPLVLVNTAAGGAGLNLHDHKTQKTRKALISPPWSAVALQQVLGRVHRAGGGFSSQEIIFAADSIEERVRLRLNERLGNLAALTDGDLDPHVIDSATSNTQ